MPHNMTISKRTARRLTYRQERIKEILCKEAAWISSATELFDRDSAEPRIASFKRQTIRLIEVPPTFEADLTISHDGIIISALQYGRDAFYNSRFLTRGGTLLQQHMSGQQYVPVGSLYGPTNERALNTLAAEIEATHIEFTSRIGDVISQEYQRSMLFGSYVR